MKLTEEQLTKARACASAEELRSLAKAEGIELTDEEAEAYFAELNSVHVSDEELDAVAGGSSKCPEEDEGCLGEKDW
ncbi:MAG: Nif11-like leader peptide family RiPP precursor [Selenomonadaceae bacterium]|nr:Nif11-like leader peptide family RiPP precursor [Selenomonadaceae bacterium]